MTAQNNLAQPDRPPLPRDAFRAQRIGSAQEPAAIKPVVVTPAYADPVASAVVTPPSLPPQPTTARAKAAKRTNSGARPFEAYGERSSSRPYALRLPDAIDLALRALAAEERSHPLRVIDRILYEHLKAIGRLPPVEGG